MRSELLGLLIAFVSLPSFASSISETPEHAIEFSSRAFLKGAAYQAMSPDAQLSYDYGVIDGLLVIERIAHRPPSDFTKCLIQGVHPLEVHATVGRFLSEHPDRLSGGMAPVVIDAISHWCLMKAGKKKK